MSNKREGRHSPLTGGSDRSTSSVYSVEAINRIGYGLRKEPETPSDEPQIVEKIVEIERTVEVIPEGAIVPQEDGTLSADGINFTAVGVELPKDTPFDAWQSLTENLLRVGNSAQWCLGDLLVFGENKQWGETYKALAEKYGYEIETLYTYAWLCRKVQISIRNRELSPAHHRLVARFHKQPHLQRQWLDWASSGNPDERRVSVAEMRIAMRGTPPALSDNPLADQMHRQRMNKIWRNINNIEAISLDDIDSLRKWLDSVERIKRG
jgi:hypothetical protein